MYNIIPNTKHDIGSVKKVSAMKKLQEVLSGTPQKPFGFYDFIIVGTASFLYFFFTGLAIVRGKNIPPQWLALAKKLDKGAIAKKIIQEVDKKPNMFKVTDINKPTPIADAAGNPLRK